MSVNYQIIRVRRGSNEIATTGESAVLVRNAAALNDLSDDLPPGSIAHTAGYAEMWEKDLDGEWTQIGE